MLITLPILLVRVIFFAVSTVLDSFFIKAYPNEWRLEGSLFFY